MTQHSPNHAKERDGLHVISAILDRLQQSMKLTVNATATVNSLPWYTKVRNDISDTKIGAEIQMMLNSTELIRASRDNHQSTVAR